MSLQSIWLRQRPKSRTTRAAAIAAARACSVFQCGIAQLTAYGDAMGLKRRGVSHGKSRGAAGLPMREADNAFRRRIISAIAWKLDNLSVKGAFVLFDEVTVDSLEQMCGKITFDKNIPLRERITSLSLRIAAWFSDEEEAGR